MSAEGDRVVDVVGNGSLIRWNGVNYVPQIGEVLAHAAADAAAEAVGAMSEKLSTLMAENGRLEEAARAVLAGIDWQDIGGGVLESIPVNRLADLRHAVDRGDENEAGPATDEPDLREGVAYYRRLWEHEVNLRLRADSEWGKAAEERDRLRAVVEAVIERPDHAWAMVPDMRAALDRSGVTGDENSAGGASTRKGEDGGVQAAVDTPPAGAGEPEPDRCD